MSAKITTKTGDTGLTGLLGPGRVPKEDQRIEALGAVDEATSALGLARAWCDGPYVHEVILQIQRDLYTLMAELAVTAQRPDVIHTRIAPEHVAWLERTQEHILARVTIPSQFILPGDTRSGATLDFARATVRRAERAVSRLLHEGVVANAESLRYLNRLSDLLFVLARFAEADTGGSTLARTPEHAALPGGAKSLSS